MTTTAPTHEQQASEFAEAVRERLADLPESELDELLDGLPADLAERLADGGELGDPAQYADELRQAAGLPARGELPKVKKGVGESFRETRIELTRRAHAFWGATPARRGVRDFVLALRPLWWVARGLVLGWFLGWWFGLPAPLGPILSAALVLVSVQWGRGKWAPKKWLVVLRRVASVLAAVLLLPGIGLAWNSIATPNYVYVDQPWGYGLFANGEPINNVFAFDCAGQPLDGVQLFDQNGRPITTLDGELGSGAEPQMGWDEETQQPIRYERNGFAGFAGTWNVFPLQEARAEANGVHPHLAQPEAAKWPMGTTLPLSPDCPTGEPVSGDADPRPDAEEPQSDETAARAEAEAQAAS